MGIDITTFVLGDEGLAEILAEAIELRQGDHSVLGQPLLSKHETCKRFMFLELPVGWNKGFVYTDRRQIGVCLSGQLHFQTSDGLIANLSPGKVWQFKDKDAKGITAEVIGNEPVKCLIVQLD